MRLKRFIAGVLSCVLLLSSVPAVAANTEGSSQSDTTNTIVIEDDGTSEVSVVADSKGQTGQIEVSDDTESSEGSTSSGVSDDDIVVSDIESDEDKDSLSDTTIIINDSADENGVTVHDSFQQNVFVGFEAGAEPVPGSTVTLDVRAVNTNQDDAVEGRVYLLNYDGEPLGNVTDLADVSVGPNTAVELSDFEDGKAVFETETGSVEASLVEETDPDSGELTARYISFEIPADTEFVFSTSVVSNGEIGLTALPVVSDFIGQSQSIRWTSSITVEDLAVENSAVNTMGIADVDIESHLKIDDPEKTSTFNCYMADRGGYLMTLYDSTYAIDTAVPRFGYQYPMPGEFITHAYVVGADITLRFVVEDGFAINDFIIEGSDGQQVDFIDEQITDNYHQVTFIVPDFDVFLNFSVDEVVSGSAFSDDASYLTRYNEMLEASYSTMFLVARAMATTYSTLPSTVYLEQFPGTGNILYHEVSTYTCLFSVNNGVDPVWATMPDYDSGLKSEFFAYCGDSSGNTPPLNVDRSYSEITGQTADRLKFVFLMQEKGAYYQGPLYQYRSLVFGSYLLDRMSDWNDNHLYLHALLSAIYSGAYYGLTEREKSEIAAAASRVANLVASGNYDDILSQYKIYAISPPSSGYQPVLFVWRYQARGDVGIQKSAGSQPMNGLNSNYSLAGAVYRVYNTDGTYTGVSLTTDASGWAATTGGALEAGSYYLQEYTPPKGYKKDDTKYSFTVVGGQTATVGNAIKVKETPVIITLELTKSSQLPNITDDNNCYSLQGAVYGVYTNENCTGSPVATMTTNASGYAKVTNLALGKYWIKEITPSKGYDLDPTIYGPYDWTTSSNNQDISKTVDVTEYPRNDPGGIRITKIWNGVETDTIPDLEGTEFTVYYFDTLASVHPSLSSYTRKWIFQIKQHGTDEWYLLFDDEHLMSGSDPLYYNEDGVACLPLGTYAIIETKSAPGYTTDGFLQDQNGSNVSNTNEVYWTQVKDQSGDVHLVGGNYYEGKNDPTYGKIIIKKFDDNGTSPLAGATFEIKSKSGYPETLPGWKSQMTTGANGIITFDNLYPDVYTITEIDSPDGHLLLKEPIVINVPTWMTESEMQQHGVDKSNAIYDPFDNVYYIHNLTYEITNSEKFVIPMTGGMSDPMTFLPLAAGVGLLGAVVTVVVIRRRKRHE